MKKVLGSMLAAFMLFAAANTAAAFGEYDLTVVFYNPDDTEVAFNLGPVQNSDSGDYLIDFGAQDVVLREGTMDYSILNSLPLTDSLADVRVGAWGYSRGYDALEVEWGLYSNAQDIDPTPAADTNLFQFQNATHEIYMTYGDAPEDVEFYGTDSNEFHRLMNQTGNAWGQYNGLNRDSGYEVIGTFNEDGVCELYLYQQAYDWLAPEDSERYDVMYTVDGYGVNAGKNYVAKLSIHEDGTVILNASEVPVPGAVILLGSGLLGLVGIRRKK